MARIHDAPRVREHDDAVAERLLREVFPPTETETEGPERPPAELPPAPTGRPVRWLRWLAATAAIVVLVVAAAIVLTREESPTTAPTPTAQFHTADWWEHQLAVAPATPVFHTADWWERELTPAPVVHTPDWYEHQATVVPVGAVAHTPDWYEHVLASTLPDRSVQRTADGWERYLQQLTELRQELLTR